MKPNKIYSDSIDEQTLNQFYDALKQPTTIRGVLLPDAHLGYTLPIGAVILTDNVVFPSYVGYDIGCGVCALKTAFVKKDVVNNSQKIYEDILKVIPTGSSHRQTPINYSLHNPTEIGKTIAEEKEYQYQLGTLGGGNHFIEVGYDENDAVWIIIHSGSRGIGHSIATHYMKLASGTNRAVEGHVGFSIESQEGKDYLQDMNMCIAFALENRRQMLTKVANAIYTYYKSSREEEGHDWPSLINRTHNHAEVTDEGIIHRKGATHANLGMDGVIPGNMRDGSFIVTGLGNPDSLCSSSHGAGRVLGRNQAKKTLNQDDFNYQMEGVTCATEGRLDESPGAYKNIFNVMSMQSDLVKVVAHIKPILNVKG